jgi:peptidoglycan/xylan/chitin deacetylase (PgdA/CDA1 family)
MKTAKKDIITTLIIICFITGALLYFALLQKTSNQKNAQIVPPNTTSSDINKEVKIPIITYHYVEVVTDERDFIRKNLAILPGTFENQIKELRAKGYEPIFVKEIPDIIKGTLKPEKSPVALTFDDGYEDFYTNVLPIIKRNNVKVTAYIVPNFIGHLNYMTKTQLQEVIASGLVEIGSHTNDHADLPNSLDENAKATISNSKTTLENMFNIKVVTFSYPYGFYNEKIAEMVKDAGYTAAVSEVEGTEQSLKNLYYLSRIRVGYFDTIF